MYPERTPLHGTARAAMVARGEAEPLSAETRAAMEEMLEYCRLRLRKHHAREERRMRRLRKKAG